MFVTRVPEGETQDNIRLEVRSLIFKDLNDDNKVRLKTFAVWNQAGETGVRDQNMD